MESKIRIVRDRYHKSLLERGVLSVDNAGVPSNADKSSRLSVRIAKSIAEQLLVETHEKCLGQTLGAAFETINLEFLTEAFPLLSHLRPGKWHLVKLGNRNALKTSSFYQYSHLEYLSEIVKHDANIASCLGNSYLVAPDIVMYREPEDDSFINNSQLIVDDNIATMTAIREHFNKLPILHASISAKWTMRSDRAQNSRTEALGLIRNRKGHLPHIAVITGEPLPARLASLALGTGDIDCMYHFALYELIEAVKQTGAEDSIEMLDILISGKRLKDISDLPFDLAI